MDGLGILGQVFRGSKYQNPPQVQLVDFLLLDLGHRNQDSRSPGCDCRLGRFSRKFSLIGRARQDGFRLVVRCAISLSSPKYLCL